MLLLTVAEKTAMSATRKKYSFFLLCDIFGTSCEFSHLNILFRKVRSPKLDRFWVEVGR